MGVAFLLPSCLVQQHLPKLVTCVLLTQRIQCGSHTQECNPSHSPVEFRLASWQLAPPLTLLEITRKSCTSSMTTAGRPSTSCTSKLDASIMTDLAWRMNSAQDGRTPSYRGCGRVAEEEDSVKVVQHATCSTIIYSSKIVST
jgi:hypothetical protein